MRQGRARPPRPRLTGSARQRASPRAACRARSSGRGRWGLVSRGLGGLGALEQHVAGAVAPARGTGEDLAVGEDRFADDFFPRIVGRRAVAVAGEHAEIVARDHDDVDPLDLVEDVVDHADARRVLDLDHDQDVVVGVGGIPIAPETGGLVLARAAMPQGLVFGLSRSPIGILGIQDRVAGLLDRLDHRHDDTQRAGIAGFQDVADVRGRHTHERDAPRFGDHLDQLLRFTPGERAVLHLDPDEILAFAGFLRGFEVGMDDRVAEDLLAGLEFRDHGVEGQRTRP